MTVRRSNLTIALLGIMASAVTVFGSGTHLPWYWQVMQYREFAKSESALGLAPNNGWAIAKPHSRTSPSDTIDSIQVVYHADTGIARTYYLYTTDYGRNWIDFLCLSGTQNRADAAYDATIACIGDTTAVAFYDYWSGSANTRNIGYTHKYPSHSWIPLEQMIRSTTVDHHRAARHPSLALQQWQSLDRAGLNTSVVWAESTKEVSDWMDCWAPYENEVRIVPHFGVRQEMRIGDNPEHETTDYVSIAWDGDPTGQDVYYYAFDKQKSDGTHDIWVGYHQYSSGADGLNLTDGPNSPPSGQRPSIQCTHPCTATVAYHAPSGGVERIYVAVVDYDGGVLAASENDAAFSSGVLPNVPLRYPNLWHRGDSVFMAFEGGASAPRVYFSLSTDRGKNWCAPVRVSGWNESTSTASLTADWHAAFIAYRRGPCAQSNIQSLRIREVRAAHQVAEDGGPPNSARAICAYSGGSPTLVRTYAGDGFVAVSRTTDGGQNWQDIFSPGFGGKPTIATDCDSVVSACFVSGCTLYCAWWRPDEEDWSVPQAVLSVESDERIGQPSVALYPGKSDGVKVAVVSAVVYDSSAGTSQVMFFKVDTGRVVVDTVESVDNLADSFPCPNVANSDSIYLTLQHGDSVVSSKLLDYGRGNWNKPPAWSSLELVTADGYHPMSVLEGGDMLHCVWSERIAHIGATDTFNICRATCDVSQGAMFPGWTAGTNPSAGNQATAEKADPVYAGSGCAVWREMVSGDWQIMARVRDTVITLISAPDTNLYCPAALAESSAVSPSIDQLRLATHFFKAVVDSGETCGIVCFQCDSFNVSNAGPGATRYNSGTKLVRTPASDSLFAVYCDADGGVYLAQSATGDSWKRSDICTNGENPALAYDGTGKLWVIYHDLQECKVLARYRTGDTWSTAKSIYDMVVDDSSGISLAGSPDGTTSCVYAAFRITDGGGKSVIVAKFDKDSLRTTKVAEVEVDNPCIAVENSGGQGDWLHVAWEDNGNVKYTMTTDDWAAENWQSFPSWEEPVTLFEGGQQAARHPCLVANEDKLVVACAGGSTPDIYARERSTTDDYDDWESAVNLSNNGGDPDYPVVFLGDSAVAAWEFGDDIMACVNYGDTMTLVHGATETGYPHIVLQTVFSPDTALVLHLVASTQPKANYYEVSYAKYDLTEMGGGQQGAGTKPLAIEPALFPCRPNPFTGRTAISYQFPKAGEVSLRVFDASGRMVRSLQSGFQKPGKYTAVWDGNDSRGRRVANGIYFYRLDTPDYRNVKKAVLMR